jgi:quercetin dioxygenase-like cupin family protein
MRKTLILVLLLAVGIVIGALGNQALNAQQQIKRAMLLKHDVTGFENREGDVLEVVLPPGAELGWHHHPGQEFFYVVEGTGVQQYKDKPSDALKPGVAYYRGVEEVHNIQNTGTAPLRIIGFLVAEKGKPLLIPDKP